MTSATTLSLFDAALIPGPIALRRTATLSDDGIYRYVLGREWDTSLPGILWIALNPSTADSEVDDNTVRRLLSFSKRWNFGRLSVCNLFAFRATDPREMKAAPDAVGPENDATILREVAGAARIVVCWGTHGGYRDRDRAVMRLIGERGAECLRVTKDGFPMHPLYAQNYMKLRAYTGRKEEGKR